MLGNAFKWISNAVIGGSVIASGQAQAALVAAGTESATSSAVSASFLQVVSVCCNLDDPATWASMALSLAVAWFVMQRMTRTA